MPAQEIISADQASETTQSEIKQLSDALLYFASAIMDKIPRLDSVDRSVVNVETGTIAVSSLPTLGAVTTLTNLTNVQNFVGGNTNNIPNNLSDAGLVRLYQGISVTP